MDKLREFVGGTVERCGFILANGEIVEVPNQSIQAHNSFEVSDEDFLRYADQMVGTWHTHVNGVPNLSLPDYYTFMDFPDMEHWVVSEPATVCFRVREGHLMIDEVKWYEND